jgi:hypothetical protein
MTLVKQKHSRGCAVCIAMVATLNYDDLIKAHFGKFGKVEGMTLDHQVQKELKLMGFETRFEYKNDYNKTEKDRKFTEPVNHMGFSAYIYELLYYDDSPCAHFVVMDDKGTVFDPMFGIAKWADYTNQPYSRLIIWD